MCYTFNVTVCYNYTKLQIESVIIMSKKFICLLMVLSCCVSLCACMANSTTAPITEPAATEPTVKTIKIPDIENLDLDTAKTLLAGKGLIPKIAYEYSNDYDYDMVIRTEPAIGSEVEEDQVVTLYICNGPAYFEFTNTVGRMYNVTNIDAFSWGDDGKPQTKGFYAPYAEDGFLYIPMFLKCTSKYTISFYKDFGTASITDTFDKTVPITILYDSPNVSNTGGYTDFTAKIPLGDLDVQKPTTIAIQFDFLVGTQRQTFKASFNLTWH